MSRLATNAISAYARPVKPEVRAILDRVRDTCDYGYVPFTDINDTNSLGDNALHCVVIWGDLEAARILIAEGIDINRRGEDGYTPLHQAAAFGHSELVKLLLESGADINARTDGDLPFTVARLSGHDSICEMISAHAVRVPLDTQAKQRDKSIQK